MDDLWFLSQVADDLGSVPPGTALQEQEEEDYTPASLTLGQTQHSFTYKVPVDEAKDVDHFAYLLRALTYDLHANESFTTPLILKYYTERRHRRRPPQKLLFPKSVSDSACLIAGPMGSGSASTESLTPMSHNPILREALTDRLLLTHVDMDSKQAEVLAHKVTSYLELILEHIITRDKAIRTLYSGTLNHNKLPLKEILINHTSVLSAASRIIPNELSLLKAKLDQLTDCTNKK